MSRFEQFTDEIQRAMSPRESGPIFAAIEMAAGSRGSYSPIVMVQMLPEIAQTALASLGLKVLVDELRGDEPGTTDTPLEALKRRYVNDEITHDEYTARLAELGPEAAPAQSRRRDPLDEQLDGLGTIVDQLQAIYDEHARPGESLSTVMLRLRVDGPDDPPATDSPAELAPGELSAVAGFTGIYERGRTNGAPVLVATWPNPERPGAVKRYTLPEGATLEDAVAYREARITEPTTVMEAA